MTTVGFSEKTIQTLQQVQNQKAIYIDGFDIIQKTIIDCIDEDEYGKDAFCAIRILQNLRSIFIGLT